MFLWLITPKVYSMSAKEFVGAKPTLGYVRVSKVKLHMAFFDLLLSGVIVLVVRLNHIISIYCIG